MTEFEKVFLTISESYSYNDTKAASILLDSYILAQELGYINHSVEELRTAADRLHPKIAIVQSFYNDGVSQEILKAYRPVYFDRQAGK